MCGPVISSRRAETAARPSAGAQGGTEYLAPRPSAQQGRARAARRSPAGRARGGRSPRVGHSWDTKRRHTGRNQPQMTTNLRVGTPGHTTYRSPAFTTAPDSAGSRLVPRTYPGALHGTSLALVFPGHRPAGFDTIRPARRGDPSTGGWPLAEPQVPPRSTISDRQPPEPRSTIGQTVWCSVGVATRDRNTLRLPNCGADCESPFRRVAAAVAPRTHYRLAERYVLTVRHPGVTNGRSLWRRIRCVHASATWKSTT